ncbi:hypothetical protein CRUP_024608 [Coryphaenoides rupestris]|nr:hypothetical protein CRUP_024608 [Coryphaenoides rupestris]
MVVGAFSVLHNTLVLGLTWGRQLDDRTGDEGRPHAEAIGSRYSPAGIPEAVLERKGQWNVLRRQKDTVEIPGSQGVTLGPTALNHLSSLTQGPSVARTLTALFPAVLAVITGLVLLLGTQDCVPVKFSCTPLVYLDVASSLMAALVLTSKVVPVVYHYGLLLLQASPTNVSIPELEVKITRIPGVQSLHDLHIWQLTETCTVASVHIHCQDGFQKHRCGDLILAVTKVIRSVGISCCTIQPEFPLPPPHKTAMPLHRYAPRLWDALKLKQGIYTRLPEHYLRSLEPKKSTPVHWKPQGVKYKANPETGLKERVQDVPVPIYYPPESQDGLWGSEGWVAGFRYANNDKMSNRLKKVWKPWLMKQELYSEILDHTFTITTHKEDLKSKLGMDLKRTMLLRLARKDAQLHPEDPAKRAKIYNKYKKFEIPEEEAAWVGLNLEQAEPEPVFKACVEQLVKELTIQKLSEPQLVEKK